MGEKRESQLITTCASLARCAESGSREVDGLLSEGNAAQGAYAEFSQLRPLSNGLHQLCNDIYRLKDGLEGTPAMSSRLRSILSGHLAECNAAGFIVSKQLMRLAPDTPTEAINMATILQYESFLNATVKLLQLLSRILQQDSIVKQDEEIDDEDVKLLMIRVATLCRTIGMSGRSGGILLDSPNGRSSSSAKGSLDSLPPAYEAAPPFPESPIHARHGLITPPRSSSSSGSKDRSSAGFKGFFSKPFRAATDALRAKPEPLVTPLCQAATIGSLAQLKFLLSEGANINGHDEEGSTALIRAISSNQLGVVEYLLKSGADHSVCGSSGGGGNKKPPLFHAVDAENGGAIDVLLESGASPNQRHDWGEPYFTALVRGATPPEWIELLLSRGADANMLDNWLQPLVVVALKKRQNEDDREEVVRLLLRYGAKPGTRDSSGVPLVHLCVAQRREGLVRHLLQLGADPNSSDISGTPLLVTAVKKHNRALVETLLKHGADANAHDIYLTHILLVVFEDSKLVHADKVALMMLLLEHGAKPRKANDSWDVTLLEKALDPYLAAVNKGGSADGSTELTSALLEIPGLLLKHGADPNQRLKGKKNKETKQAPTILKYALEQPRGRDLAELALRYGADADLAGL
ncbi:hypothetical protein PG993_012564 [Apiospora rasikravindrae]|uniref:Ankyrin repeat protein n=1 Tax=Apiospora rasikravindrae TaxID=990691 RepID=A0ABR1S2Y0_9PEZI